MIRCQCPKCRNSFQVAADYLGSLQPCPKCRFLVEVVQLSIEGLPAAPPDMITCECPRCRMKFPAKEASAGQDRLCPDCGFPTQVPLPRGNWLSRVGNFFRNEGAGRTTVYVGFVILFVFGIWVVVKDKMGTNANSAFGTVGSSIGKMWH